MSLRAFVLRIFTNAARARRVHAHRSIAAVLRRVHAHGVTAAVLGVAMGLAPVGVARAEVRAHSIWERAGNPGLMNGDDLHRSIQGLLLVAYQLYPTSPMRQEHLAESLRLLDEFGAESARDVRLRFDLGTVLSLLGRDERAARVLESAIAIDPDDPAAVSAYSSLAIAYAKLGRVDEEILAYEAYLRRETSPDERSRAFCNRAESQVRRGHLAEAVSDYRAALVLQPDSVLCHWGLAMALDRGGDAPGAFAEVKTAINYDPLDQELSSQHVFFVPAYERYWYDGLGAMTRALQIDDAGTSLLWWEAAIAKWELYIGLAASGDRWIPLAKAHQATCERRLRDAKRAAAAQSKGRKQIRVDVD